jgi:hypothetical protein
VWGFLPVVAPESSSLTTRSAIVQQPTKNASERLTKFSKIWKRLDEEVAPAQTKIRPGIDTQINKKPEPIVRSTSPAAAPPFRLLGTIVESDQRMAFLADASGNIDLVAVGQPIELIPAGSALESIDRQFVVLATNGTRKRIEMPTLANSLSPFADNDSEPPSSMRRSRPAILGVEPSKVEASDVDDMDLDAELDWLNGS